MITGIQGNIFRLNLQTAQINTGGVVYEAWISFKTYLALKDSGDNQVFLYTYHSITDRSQKLFGFLSEAERDFFTVLKGLNGIGEMTALKVLSFFSPGELFQLLETGSAKDLERMPKVRAKTSEKIFFELKQNQKKLEAIEIERERTQNPEAPASNDSQLEKNLAIQACIQLGFDEKTSQKMVSDAVKSNPEADSGELVRIILQST